MYDVTEKVSAERALRKSEERYRMLHESMRDAFVHVSMDGRVIEFNDLYCKMLGYSPEEVLKLTYKELTPERWHAIEDDIVHEQIIPRGYSDVFQKEYRRKDGSIIPVELRTILSRDESGRPNGMWAIVRDISERKKVEEALKKAHQNLEEKVKERTSELEKAYNSLKESEKSLADSQKMAHLGNWTRNIMTGEVHWSDEVYRIFGFKPKEFGVTYDSFLNRVHPDDKDHVIKGAKQALENKLPSIDYRIIVNNREERTVHEEVKVIFDEKNNPVQLKGTIQDITEHKKAEEALEKIEIVRKKEIHHRIKNNLQVISSLLDLQAEQFRNRNNIQDSEVLEAFRESQSRVISMALIHEELYKGEGFETLNFSLYIKELAENLFNTYKLENVDLILNIGLKDNIFFDMDTAVPLGMIVNELVSNSLKYAFPDRKTGEMQIKLFSEEAKDEKSNKDITGKSTTYTLIVSDNGIGIPENVDLENLETLGLQLVNILVDQLDGEIELKKNNGTEFKIIISL